MNDFVISCIGNFEITSLLSYTDLLIADTLYYVAPKITFVNMTTDLWNIRMSQGNSGKYTILLENLNFIDINCNRLFCLT